MSTMRGDYDKLRPDLLSIENYFFLISAFDRTFEKAVLQPVGLYSTIYEDVLFGYGLLELVNRRLHY